jgi:GNAT superfamily N-acetyltransferase
MTITIHPVQTESEKRAFYKFAFRVYCDDPNWVPHLWPGKKAYLDKKSAFFIYGEGEFWLAKDGKEIVGTIGTAIDHARNRGMNWKVGLFGFFEVLPGRYDAAEAMWDFARDWARGRGMTELQGPYSFSGEDDYGFLVQGWDTASAPLMGHTPRYYAEFADRYGFQKIYENVAYRVNLAGNASDMEKLSAVITRIAARARQRHGGSVRVPKMKDWDREVEILWRVYNTSLAVLPEFSPMELAAFREQAAGLKEIIDPELVFIAEVDGKPVGFALGLPNVAEALKRANGLQYPWDYLRLAVAMKRIKSASFKIMAMDPEYWGYGVDSILYLEMMKAILRKGYTWVDASLTGEDNPQTNKLLSRAGADIYRRYCIYRLGL